MECQPALELGKVGRFEWNVTLIHHHIGGQDGHCQSHGSTVNEREWITLKTEPEVPFSTVGRPPEQGKYFVSRQPQCS